MRTVATMAFLVGLLSTSSRAAIAQVPQSAIAPAPVSRLDTVIAAIRVNTSVRVLTRDTVPLAFRLATRRPATLDLYEAGRELPLDPSHIDSLWVSGRAPQTTLGMIVGGILGVGFFTSMARMDGGGHAAPGSHAAFGGQAVGLLVGGSLGAMFGSALASPKDRWRLRYGRPSA